MKTAALFAALFAGLIATTPVQAFRVAGPGVSATLAQGAAVADRWDRRGRYERGRTWHRERRYHRERRSYRGGWGWRTDCRTQWRDGRREQVCRRSRYRR